MPSLFHSHSPFRIFAVSGVVSIIALALVFIYLGPVAAFITLVLMAIEITFSFENAIINARVLVTMSTFWQRMFMTIGILIAVFGMRVIFPILVVMLTAGLPWNDVINLALHQPEKYAEELHKAHPSIAAFGGMFLLMLCLHFFFDPLRKIHWISIIERPLQRIGTWWVYSAVCFLVLSIVAVLPFNAHPRETFLSGITGMIVYLAIHALAEFFTRHHEKAEKAAGKSVQKAGLAGLTAFLYLEVLDASFSFDGVIGAFAVTQDVILIAIGLGIGALWVRSLTLFMVRRKVLAAYRFLEHGAHYTIGILAIVLLIGLFRDIPEVVAGIIGVAIITASIVSSIKASKAEKSLRS
ncbi:MAG TPA: DUF475 domain-containing protein [Candidatus Saccharimonadales bacterium]|nr:DUF475 domain-containing protein [Candidatus Saccharimonadales bacterium]